MDRAVGELDLVLSRRVGQRGGHELRGNLSRGREEGKQQTVIGSEVANDLRDRIVPYPHLRRVRAKGSPPPHLTGASIERRFEARIVVHPRAVATITDDPTPRREIIELSIRPPRKRDPCDGDRGAGLAHLRCYTVCNNRALHRAPVLDRAI